MILKKSQNKISSDYFREMAYYFGIAVQSDLTNIVSSKKPKNCFMDIEIFFLAATYNLKTSRIAEAFLCWLLKYGHLLSPSKIRRLIVSGEFFDSAVLGGIIVFLCENKIHAKQWKIVLPFCRKRKIVEPLLAGPFPRTPSSYFLKYRIAAPQFQLDIAKFLFPVTTIYKNCIELGNRSLFGSVVHADMASYLKKHPRSTPYQIAKKTHHHKARIFAIYADVRSHYLE